MPNHNTNHLNLHFAYRAENKTELGGTHARLLSSIRFKASVGSGCGEISLYSGDR